MPHTASHKDFVNVIGDFILNGKQNLTAYKGYSDSYDERNGLLIHELGTKGRLLDHRLFYTLAVQLIIHGKMDSYISRLRKKIGTDKFIHPGARIIVENDKGEILLIERTDNGSIGLPAGALEENETIEECIIREVREETGIEIIALEVIGISSGPKAETVQYPNGDKIQYFTVEFYSNQWTGALNTGDNLETKRAAFNDRSHLERLPENERLAFESLEYYQREQRIKLR